MSYGLTHLNKLVGTGGDCWWYRSISFWIWLFHIKAITAADIIAVEKQLLIICKVHVLWILMTAGKGRYWCMAHWYTGAWSGLSSQNGAVVSLRAPMEQQRWFYSRPIRKRSKWWAICFLFCIIKRIDSALEWYAAWTWIGYLWCLKIRCKSGENTCKSMGTAFGCVRPYDTRPSGTFCCYGQCYVFVNAIIWMRYQWN